MSCNEQVVGNAYCEAFASWFQGFAIQQQADDLELSRIDIKGKRSGYTPEQRAGYEETIRLRIRAEEILSKGDIFGAIKVEESRLPIMEKVFGPNDYALGLVHQWKGQRLSDAARAEESLDAFQKAIELFSLSLGQSHPETLLNRSLAGTEMSVLGRNEEAEKLMRSALQKLLPIAGTGSSRTQAVANRFTNVLGAKAVAHLKRREYEEFAKCLQERFELMPLADPEDGWGILQAKRDHDNAVQLLALDEPQQKLMAKWLDQISELHLDREQGRELIVLGKLKDSLKTAQELFGEDHYNTARAKLALSRCALNCGDPGLAISLAEQVVDFWRINGVENDPDLVSALISLGSTYSGADRNAEAEKLFREAATFCYHAKQLESELYAICLMERGSNQIRIGDNDEAKRSLTQALKIFGEISDAAGENALRTRERLADLCRAEGDLSGAQAYLDQQRSLVLQRYGNTSAPHLEVLCSEAILLVMLSRFDEAVARYEEALDLAREGFGQESGLYRSILEGLVAARAWQGNDTNTEEFLELVDLQQRRRESLFESYPQRLQFDRVVLDRPMLSTVLQLAVAKRIKATDAYERVLVAKGAVTAYQRSLRLSSRDPESKKLVTQLRDLSSQIASLTVQSPTKKQQAELSELLQQKEKLDVQLAQQSRGTRKALRHVRIPVIQQSLPADAVLIDYVEYDRLPNLLERMLGKTSIPAMLAFVVAREQEIQLVELGDREQIDIAAVQWLHAIREEPYVAHNDAVAMAAAVDERGAALRRLVWDPLERHVMNSETAIISPDGILLACPFAALPEGDGFLVEQKAIVYTPAVSTLPELISRDAGGQSLNPHLLIVDDVDYGKPVAADNQAVEAGDVPFVPLPSDSEGIQLLKNIFQERYHTGQIEQLNGLEAREAEFKKRVEKAQFVHLVTHDFCLRASDLQLTVDFGGSDNKSSDTSSDPIVAGIAFSGANSGLSYESEDSILWADEISSLDLHQAELVVLFACESALGEYAAGEGMLGCQRALYVAGAQASLGTLWSVQLGATQELMKQFYLSHWAQSQSKAEALRSAMTHMMWAYPEPRRSSRHGGSAIRYPPALWAGFVLGGDWQ